MLTTKEVEFPKEIDFRAEVHCQCKASLGLLIC